MLPVAAWALEARIDPVGVADRARGRAAAALTLLLLRRGQSDAARSSAPPAAALILFVSAYAYQLPRLRTIWISPRIAEAVARARPCAATTVASTPYTEPSLVFLLGTGTVLTDAQGAAEHLLRDPACGLALVGADQRDAFLAF